MSGTIELDLTGIAHGGEALGRHGSKVVFVPYAIPGERVRVEIVAEEARWARARLLQVIRASPDRVEPPCPYFGPGQCGGCQWQHIAYPRQAELKQEIVADQLRRLGHMDRPRVADIVALADPASPDDAPLFMDYAYRNQTRFLLTPESRTGYLRTDGRTVIAVERCLLLHERVDSLHAALDVAWPGLTALGLRIGLNTDQAMILLETVAGEEPELELDLPAACVLLTPRGPQPLIGDPWIEEAVGTSRYRVSASSRFPANTVGAAALVELVMTAAAPQPADVILNAYCGVGLYSLPLAKVAAEVIGIEASPSACEDFAHNAQDAANISLHEGAVEAVLPALQSEGQHFETMVLEPPRAGAGEAALRELVALRPHRIVYVAADPAALARDGIHLTAAGYRLREAQPVDVAPQTYHSITVALWTK